ncbi:hypothetical protein OG206_25920 [Streptomyces sp. NBC_01341]|uniref:hypothetical protein n=1 Tax=Streptomyces sp. NBC_01341 TaxID=2903831 RepID=UPI002E0FDEBA|nr:hypothetical protein OG206_25920 [Streptomyces sp. NBC_01341]
MVIQGRAARALADVLQPGMTVGAMVHGRTGSRTLDDPACDDLFATVAGLHQPVSDRVQLTARERSPRAPFSDDSYEPGVWNPWFTR